MGQGCGIIWGSEGSPVMGLRDSGFLTFHMRPLLGSQTRCAFSSLVRSVSTAMNPLPYGLSGPSGIASTFTCAAQHTAQPLPPEHPPLMKCNAARSFVHTFQHLRCSSSQG